MRRKTKTISAHTHRGHTQGNRNMRPEREILEDRENPEIRKVHNKKKNAPNQNIPKTFSAKNGQKKKVSKKKIGTKPLKQTPCPNR